MTRNDIKVLRQEFSSKRNARFIKLKDFITLEGDHYDRKEFSEPRNVIVSGNDISFDVENWTTYKSQTVTVPLRSLGAIWF